MERVLADRSETVPVGAILLWADKEAPPGWAFYETKEKPPTGLRYIRRVG